MLLTLNHFALVTNLRGAGLIVSSDTYFASVNLIVQWIRTNKSKGMAWCQANSLHTSFKPFTFIDLGLFEFDCFWFIKNSRTKWKVGIHAWSLLKLNFFYCQNRLASSRSSLNVSMLHKYCLFDIANLNKLLMTINYTTLLRVINVLCIVIDVSCTQYVWNWTNYVEI